MSSFRVASFASTGIDYCFYLYAFCLISIQTGWFGPFVPVLHTLSTVFSDLLALLLVAWLVALVRERVQARRYVFIDVHYSEENGSHFVRLTGYQKTIIYGDADQSKLERIVAKIKKHPQRYGFLVPLDENK